MCVCVYAGRRVGQVGELSRVRGGPGPHPRGPRRQDRDSWSPAPSPTPWASGTGTHTHTHTHTHTCAGAGPNRWALSPLPPTPQLPVGSPRARGGRGRPPGGGPSGLLPLLRLGPLLPDTPRAHNGRLRTPPQEALPENRHRQKARDRWAEARAAGNGKTPGAFKEQEATSRRNTLRSNVCHGSAPGASGR